MQGGFEHRDRHTKFHPQVCFLSSNAVQQAGTNAGPGATGIECLANFYCAQGTTEPTPCPIGTISAARAFQCFPGVFSVIFLYWIFG
jgi:hypothetical protein